MYVCVYLYTYIHICVYKKYIYSYFLYLKRYFLMLNFFVLFWVIASLKYRSSSSEGFYKKGVLKNLANFTERTLSWASFLIKFQPGSLQLYWNKDSSTNVSLWILQNFSENLLCGTSANSCFENGSIKSNATVRKLSKIWLFWYRQAGALVTITYL